MRLPTLFVGLLFAFAAEAEDVPVLVLLKDQPHRQALEWAEGASSLRRQLAEGDWARAAAWLSPAAQELEQARAKLDEILIETRRIAYAETARRVAPTQASVMARMHSLRATDLRAFPTINLIAGVVPEGSLEAIAAHPDVALVARDEWHRGHLDVSTAVIGSATLWNRGFNGAGEAVAVIDSGIRAAHPAFSGRRVVTRTFSSFAARNTLCFDDLADSADDKDGHGTHVAGIVASGGSPDFPALLGVARGLGALYVLKASFVIKELPGQCPGGTGSTGSDVIAAVDWALANSPARIFNYSSGARAQADESPMSQILDYYADTAGLLFVVAAGNSGPGPSTVESPSIGYNVLSVANLDDRNTLNRSDDTIARSSSRGPTLRGRAKPDLAAPGTQINSTRHDSSGFVNLSGTSMAAPHIAGAAAVLAQMGVKNPLAIRALMINSSDGAAEGWQPDAGWGVVNLGRAQDQGSNGQTSSIAPGALKFYRGTARANWKATLAWNRHVSLSGQTIQAFLNNLNLEAYSRDGSVLQRSDTNLNSVEQIRSDARGEVLLKIKAEPAFLGGVTTEPYALAVSESGFTEVAAPQLASTCTAPPASVAPGAAFSVTCEVTNNGGLEATGLSAILAAPTGFPAVTAINLAALAGRGRASAIFSVRAPSAPGRFELTAEFTANAYGEVFRARSAPVAVTIGSGPLSTLGVDVTSIELRHRVGAAAPEARPLRLTVTGGASSYSVTVASAGNWLSVTPATGALPATLRVVADPARLAAGSYAGSITISATGASNSPFTIPVSLNVETATAVRLNARVVSKATPGGEGCPVPQSASAFLPTDARAYLWFSVDNAAQGDRASFSWLGPDGVVQQTGEWQPLATPGSWCLWTSMPIAGASAANKRGNWRVQVSWNGTDLFNIPFTIETSITIRKSLIATEADTADACVEPAPSPQVLTTDPRVFFWFLLDGTKGGETVRHEFLNPARRTAASGRWTPLSKGGSWCFVSNPLVMAGSANAAQPGTWTVNVYVDDALAFTRTFLVVKGFTLESRRMAKTVPESCAEPDEAGAYYRGDRSATVWFQVTNPAAGDTIEADFIKPDGEIYKTIPWDPVAQSGGSRCYWAWIDIAGTPAAETFGEWKVQVRWNGAELFTEKFHILSVEVSNRMTTKQFPEGTGCPVPTSAREFSAEDEFARLWFIVRGAKQGEAPNAELYDPNGRRTSTTTWQPLGADGSFCFRSSYRIAGAQAGVWTIRVFWNGIFLFNQPFTIAPPPTGNITNTTLRVREGPEMTAGESHGAGLERESAPAPASDERGSGAASSTPMRYVPARRVIEANPAPPPVSP